MLAIASDDQCVCRLLVTCNLQVDRYQERPPAGLGGGAHSRGTRAQAPAASALVCLGSAPTARQPAPGPRYPPPCKRRDVRRTCSGTLIVPRRRRAAPTAPSPTRSPASATAGRCSSSPRCSTGRSASTSSRTSSTGSRPTSSASRLKALAEHALVVAQPYSERPPRFAYELSELRPRARRRAAAARRLGRAAGGGEPYRHAACGSALEARWWCPTCELVVDDPDATTRPSSSSRSAATRGRRRRTTASDAAAATWPSDGCTSTQPCP